MAAPNDRHGSSTIQEAASLPESETALRLFWPNTAETVSARIARMQRIAASTYIVGTGVITPEVSEVFPSTKLWPPDRNVPLEPSMPVPFLVMVFRNARAVPLVAAMMPLVKFRTAVELDIASKPFPGPKPPTMNPKLFSAARQWSITISLVRPVVVADARKP